MLSARKDAVAQAVDKLKRLAKKLEGIEVVPGIPLESPTFQPPWRREDLAVFTTPETLPHEFKSLLLEHGGIEAIDIGAGVGFLRPEHVERCLVEEYAIFATKVHAPQDTVPFATNGAGDFLLLARNNSAVFLRNAYMRDQESPRVIASSFMDFLDRLAVEWELFQYGDGPPYLTS